VTIGEGSNWTYAAGPQGLRADFSASMKLGWLKALSAVTVGHCPVEQPIWYDIYCEVAYKEKRTMAYIWAENFGCDAEFRAGAEKLIPVVLVQFICILNP
jgi:hypothetical protein